MVCLNHLFSQCGRRKFYHVTQLMKRLYNQQVVKVRFAPSPTGDLHLGSLRTALLNHFFAKSQGGVSLLRIEDTDFARTRPGALKKLIEDLQWCGITYNSKPIIQSERKSVYQRHVEILLSNGSAYRCFCTPSRLAILKKNAIKLGEIPRYDNKCRSLSKDEVQERLDKNETSCIRFKLSPLSEPIEDLICGSINTNSAKAEGDPVILKADGFPTYHFANVVDDHLQEVTHVLRGIEWQISTPKHVLLYKAFNWMPPKFGHLPLILNTDGTKMSKRNEGLFIAHLRNSGIFPLAIVNFITKVGGGFKIDHASRFSRIFTMEELIENFDLAKVNLSPSKLVLSELEDMNRLEIIRQLANSGETQRLVNLVREKVIKLYSGNPDLKRLTSKQYILAVLERFKNRISKIEDLFSDELSYLWQLGDRQATDNVLEKVPVKSEILEKVKLDLSNLEFTTETLKHFLLDFAKKNNVDRAALMKSLRLILTGNPQGPAVAEIMETLGKGEVIERMGSYHKS